MLLFINRKTPIHDDGDVYMYMYLYDFQVNFINIYDLFTD